LEAHVSPKSTKACTRSPMKKKVIRLSSKVSESRPNRAVLAILLLTLESLNQSPTTRILLLWDSETKAA
jgi:hypothetical protein